jgi:hypothetical protein
VPVVELEALDESAIKESGGEGIDFLGFGLEF